MSGVFFSTGNLPSLRLGFLLQVYSPKLFRTISCWQILPLPCTIQKCKTGKSNISGSKFKGEGNYKQNWTGNAKTE